MGEAKRRKLWRETVQACVMPGVTQLPPIDGVKYNGFVVRPPQPGPVTLAIAHCAEGKAIVDICQDGLTVEECAELLKRYRIDHVHGDVNDNYQNENLAHAAAGAISCVMGKEEKPN